MDAHLAGHAGDGSSVHPSHVRPVAGVLDALDLTWREHWAVRQESITGVGDASQCADVVPERHQAMNWLN